MDNFEKELTSLLLLHFEGCKSEQEVIAMSKKVSDMAKRVAAFQCQQLSEDKLKFRNVIEPVQRNYIRFD